MATTIITKNGSGAPLAGDLTAGELAVDLTNKRLYSKDSGGNVIELGTNPGSSGGTISGATIDNSVIGGTTAAAGTFTDLTATNSFTSVGIDDNATSTAITIDSSQNVSLSGDLTVDTNTLYVDSTNNEVGINTATPSRALDVRSGQQAISHFGSTSGVRGTITLSDANSTAESNQGIGAYGNDISIFTASAQRLTVDGSSGNVGIGTGSPASLLELEGADPIITLDDTSAGGYAQVQALNGSLILMADEGASVNNSIVRFDIDGTERMRIDSSGNVGIGTSSPAGITSGITTLSISDGGAKTTGDKIGALTFITNDASYTGTYSDGVGAEVSAVSDSATGAAYGLSITTGTTGSAGRSERLRIDSSGNLLVGTTSALYAGRGPIQTLTSNTIAVNYAKTSDSIGQAGWGGIASNGDVSAYAMYYNSAITDNATYCSFFNGPDNSTNFVYVRGNILRMSTTASHIGDAAGTIVGTQTSDERIKTIETDFKYGLDSVMALTPIAYTFKDEQERRLGFGAQTTQAIIPEAVYDTGECIDGYDADENDPMAQTAKSSDTKLAMEYVQLIPVLTKAIQEQQAMIETLQAQVAELQGAN